MFFGDSTIRQIFWAAATELDADRARDRMHGAEKHSNQIFEAHGVTLVYIWDVWTNSTTLDAQLDMFRPGAEAAAEDEEDRAALLVVGTPAFWAAAFTGDDDLDIFMRGVERVGSAVHQTLEQSIVGGGNDPASVDQILLVPVLYPEYESLDGGREDTLTPQKLEYMNALLAASASPELASRVLWSYNSLTAGLEGAHDAMGVHVSPDVARAQFRIALDARCNTFTARSSPPKGTCCVAPPEMTSVQHYLTVPLVILLAARLLFSFVVKLSKVEAAVGHIVFVLLWSWLSDRSGVFDGVERHFGPVTSLFLCTAWVLVGSLRVGTTAVTGKSPTGRYLAREQSDELKGVMQGLVLIYHYTHNSRVLPVYKVVRLFIGLYFLLSAYGQSTHMLQSLQDGGACSRASLPRNYTLRHAAAVLFRLNALCILLPLTMLTTNYFSYYFSPCISFWFVVTWLTLRVAPEWNLRPRAFAAKVLIALALSHLFVSTPGVLETASRATKWAIGVYWSPKEMRFRLALDRYVPFAGMLLAGWNFQQQQKAQLQPSKKENGHENGYSVAAPPMHCTSKSHPSQDRLNSPRWATLASICATMLYAYMFILPAPLGMGHTFPKYDYNAVHPYVSPLVLVALLALRNCTPTLRRSYLKLPAALGRISLETYVLQYHVWLANDATSVLSLGLASRVHGVVAGPWLPAAEAALRLLEPCLVTAVFVALAGLTQESTQVLGQWVFGNGKSKPGNTAEREKGEIEGVDRRPAALTTDG